MIVALVLLATLQQPTAAPAGKDTTQGRPCVVVIDTVGHNYAQTDAGGGQSNSFMGGRVRAHCQGTQTRMEADSVAYYGGSGRFDMIGQVKLRDTALALDAATASYYLKDERLDAHKNVVAVNNTNHSILRGPNLTYWRAVPGVRDTLEMYATSRPTIWYRGSADSTATDSVEPYVIVADRVGFKGYD